MMIAAQRNLFTGSFNPLSLSPALWLSDTGSNPAQWDDLSGNGRHATQATSGNQPSIVANALNGRQVRRFDGVDDFLDTQSIVIGNAITMCVLIVPSSSALHDLILNKGTQWYWANGDAGTANKNSFYGNGSLGWVSANTSFTPSVSAIATAVVDSGSINFYLNGVSDGSAATSVTDAQSILRIGHRTDLWFEGAFGGDIAEIFVFSTALSNEDRRRIEQYLSQKYAIAIL
jgi:hypothetical protein